MSEHYRTLEKDVKKTASDAGAAARDLAAAGREYARDAGHRGYEAASQVCETVEGRVRENPWVALGIAGGVGLLLGLMLSTRRH